MKELILLTRYGLLRRLERPNVAFMTNQIQLRNRSSWRKGTATLFDNDNSRSKRVMKDRESASSRIGDKSGASKWKRNNASNEFKRNSLSSSSLSKDDNPDSSVEELKRLFFKNMEHDNVKRKGLNRNSPEKKELWRKKGTLDNAFNKGHHSKGGYQHNKPNRWRGNRVDHQSTFHDTFYSTKNVEYSVKKTSRRRKKNHKGDKKNSISASDSAVHLPLHLPSISSNKLSDILRIKRMRGEYFYDIGFR